MVNVMKFRFAILNGARIANPQAIKKVIIMKQTQRKQQLKKKNLLKKQESCAHLVARPEFNINSDSAFLVCNSCGTILCKSGAF
jgi:hypothetical protein